MGVMVDDLVTRGVVEPYRMFTSRAEYRLLLREDNAADRLLKKGEGLGLIPSALIKEFESKQIEMERQVHRLEGLRVKPCDEVNALLRSRGGVDMTDALTAIKLLKRPEVSAGDLLHLGLLDENLDPDIAKQIEIQVKYEGYIDRQKREADQFRRMEKVLIPDGLDYDAVPGLSRELREKLGQIRPRSLGQVSRISGVTPAALSALMVRIKAR